MTPVTSRLKGLFVQRSHHKGVCILHLEFVAHTDEVELPGLLLGVLGVIGVFEELADKGVLRFTHETLQGHVESIIVLLHKLGLGARRHEHEDRPRREEHDTSDAHSHGMP